jgi:hypothetical protein
MLNFHFKNCQLKGRGQKELIMVSAPSAPPLQMAKLSKALPEDCTSGEFRTEYQ